MYADWSRMMLSCLEKCSSEHNSEELEEGEEKCSENCARKYMLSHRIVGELLKKGNNPN